MQAPEPAGLPVTEQRNLRSIDIDALSTLGVLRLLNEEDTSVPQAVRRVLPQLAELVDAAAARARLGGRLHYFGAGTSGRLAMLDAAELPPTFGVDLSFATAHIAGGDTAVRKAVEGAEDDAEAGKLAAATLGPTDVAVGVSASGSAPYVVGALREASARGALTALVSSNPNAELGPLVDVHIGVMTGPEVITGSTRMKAGTAAKLVLNAFSTALMVRLGRCYSNMMVNMAVTNRKLRGRLVSILVQTTGSDEQRCRDALSQCQGDLKVALVHMLSGATPAIASQALQAGDGQVRAALAHLETTSKSPDQGGTMSRGAP